MNMRFHTMDCCFYLKGRIKFNGTYKEIKNQRIYRFKSIQNDLAKESVLDVLDRKPMLTAREDSKYSNETTDVFFIGKNYFCYSSKEINLIFSRIAKF